MKHLKNKTVLILLVFTMIFSITGCSEVNDNKNQEQVKIEYTPIKITTKYPESLKTRDRIMKEIRESIKSQKVYRIKKDFTKNTEEPCPDNETESHDIWDKKIYVREKMYDSQNREVYQIEDREAYNKGGGSGARGTGGGIYRFCPEEEGVVYDDKGRVKSRIKMLDSEKKYRGIVDSGRKSVLRNEEEFGEWQSRFSEYEYDETGNIVKEEITMMDIESDLYEKEIIEYENSKMKSSKKVIDYENGGLIYVEITKEYDANEKLIKKFVLRKNKHNAIRSETNFDFIKGEILTKYYDSDKAFATVTETLIGKDRAIVKRERVGDEFVIWDLDMLKKQSESIFWKRYITNKEGLIMYELNCERQMTYDYNYLPIGIYKELFINDFLYYEIDKDYGIGGTILNKIYQYNYNKDKIRINEIENNNKISDDFYLMNMQNITNKIKNDKNSESKIINKIEINNILEEYKNGY